MFISQEQADFIKELRADGLTFTEIAYSLNLSPLKVWQVANDYRPPLPKPRYITCILCQVEKKQPRGNVCSDCK